MKCLLMGERYRPILEKSLEIQGFQPIWIPDNPLLDPRLAAHIDLSVVKIGSVLTVSEHIYENSLLVNLLTNRGYLLKKCAGEQSSAYPKDVNLCACVFDNVLIHNMKYCDSTVKENTDLKLLHVNQGYANCMILSVGNYGIISSDEGIISLCKEYGIKVLQISNSYIKLDGFPEGFIGGASFADDSTVYFTGNIDLHPDGNAIREFIATGGFGIVCLSSDELFDIGSAVIV